MYVSLDSLFFSNYLISDILKLFFYINASVIKSID